METRINRQGFSRRLLVARPRAVLLLWMMIQHLDGFAPPPPQHHHFSHGTALWSTTTPTTSNNDLEGKTVKDLWKILEENNEGQVERGLKTRLKRKQDIIAYILEQSNRQEPTQDEIQNSLNAVTNAEKDEVTEKINTDYEMEDPPDNNIDSNDVLNLADALDLPSEIASKIPQFLAEKMIRRDVTSLLPIQAKSFERIYDGDDVVLQSPTGSGKTLAFVLPVVARKWKGGRRKKQTAPFVLVLLPSRELARQVGREFEKFSKGPCATVFGGVSIERHVALLKSKPQILISTPGRLRELVREGHVEYSQIRTVVLDEADTLLDKGDSPDVRSILEDLERAIGEREEDNGEYQLVLVSATMNEHVLQFSRDMEIPPNAKIRVQGSESRMLVSTAPSEPTAADSTAGDSSSLEHAIHPKQSQTSVQSVQHWHMACKSNVRTSVAMDLISILGPRLAIIFVATKAEAEGVSSALSTKLGNSVVRVLHGDMAQSSRSRTMALVRSSALEGDAQVLVATDVASRGIDLWVDLVIQFGVPRISGKEGTFSTELYTHRTGRTGRVRSNQSKEDGIKPSNTVMLYDPALGEGKHIPDLTGEIKDMLGVDMLPKQLPSAAEVVAAGYDRARRSVNLGDKRPDKSDLVSYFRSILETEEGVDTTNPQEILEYFARSMALLSQLDPSISPFEQHASLLSGGTMESTLRFYRTDGEAVSPPEVTKTCKKHGSGKLGRVLICEDGSAVFDLSTKRAVKLLRAFKTANEDFQLELPLSLPDL